MSNEDGNDNVNGDDGGKIDCAMAGYSFKLQIFQVVASTASQQLPSFASQPRSRKGGRIKTYCVLWGSGDLILDPELDKSVLVPFSANGTPRLEAVKKILASAGKDKTCMQYLTQFNMLDHDLRIFDLKRLGLQLICLPDPRPKAVLESKNARINIPLANDDNRLASLLLLAENGFDLSLIQDIFGPVIIMLSPVPHPRDFKIKNMLAFNAEDFSGFFDQLNVNFNELQAAFSQPKRSVRHAYKRQLKGKAPPTDLLSHVPMSYNEKSYAACGNPLCPDRETNQKFQVCAKCKSIFYCSATCQHAHWPTHKADCKKEASKRTC